jgi:hypothetical protein
VSQYRETRETIPRRRVYSLQAEAWRILSDYHDDTFRGGNPEESDWKTDMARAIMDYYNGLRGYRKEASVSAEWERLEELIESIRARRGAMITIEVEAAGDTRATKTKQVPAVRGIHADFFIETLQELDDVAYALGFSAEVQTKRPTGVVGR